MMAWLIENWRDAILIVVALLGVYMVFSVMRLVQLSRASTRADFSELQREIVRPEPTPEEERAAAMVDPVWQRSSHPEQRTVPAARDPEPAADTGELERGFEGAPEVPPEPGRSPSRLARFARWGQVAQPLAHDALATPTAAASDTFAHELRQSHLDSEIDQLRRESALLRDELALVHEELARLKATQNVSPMYSEAASLAQKGVSADGIAGQCGISLGEAELVAALARADGRGGRIEPTGYTDPNGFGGDDGTGGKGGTGNGGQPHRNRRTGTHG